MSTRDMARRVIGAQAIVDEAGAQVKAWRQQLAADMEPGDRLTVRDEDGIGLGQVYVSDPQPRIVVKDSAEFIAWVQANHPGEVVMIPSVRSSFRDALLKQATDTGELVPGMEVETGKPTLTVKPSTEARELAAGAVGAQLGLEA